MLQRRSLLAASAALPFVGLLTACGGTTASQLKADVQTIDAGLEGILSDLLAVPGVAIPAATVAQIQKALADIDTNGASIGGALAPGQSVVTDFVESVDTLASLAQPFFPQAPAIAAVITAAASLAQIVLQEAGVLKAPRFTAWSMPAPAARAVLKAAAK